MSTDFIKHAKQIYQGQPGITETTLKVIPGTLKCVILSIVVANTTSQIQSFSISLVKNGESPSLTNKIFKDVEILGNSSLHINEEFQVLEAGDYISAIQSNLNALTFTINGVEIELSWLDKQNIVPFHYAKLQGNPLAPPEGLVLLYAKEDGYLYFKDSSNVERYIGSYIDNILTTKGDTLIFNGESYDRLPCGTEGQIFIADPTAPWGVRWVEKTSQRGIAFFIDGILAVGDNIINFIAPANLTILEIRAHVDYEPSGANIIIDINKNGETIFTNQANRPKILSNTSSVFGIIPNITSISYGDRIGICIDQIGLEGTTGGSLSLTIVCLGD